MPFDRHVQILGQLHLAGAGLALAVARNTDELDARGGLHGARQIGQKDERAFQDRDQVHRLARRIVAVDLGPQFSDAVAGSVRRKATL